MPRPSKIDRLEPSLREEIGKLRGAGHTIDEILAKLRELHVEVSRSSLGRHVQEIDALSEQIQRGRAISEAVMDRFGEGRENRAARMNIELLHGVLSRFFMSTDGAPVEISAKEAQLIADSIYRLSRASKDDADLHVQAEKLARARMAEQLKELETKEGTAGRALDPDTLRRVREIYGIA